MPVYFFDTLERDGKVTRDMVGVELEGPEQALDTASEALFDSVQEKSLEHLNFKVQVIVRDENGHEVGRRAAAVSGSDEGAP